MGKDERVVISRRTSCEESSDFAIDFSGVELSPERLHLPLPDLELGLSQKA